MSDHEKTPEHDEQPQPDPSAKPPEYDPDDGSTIADDHTAAAVGDEGPAGERMDG
jgi:hypothetical protein